MASTATLRCAHCETRDCVNGKDCLGDADRLLAVYRIKGVDRLHRAATAIEARHYCKASRIREVMLLAEELGIRKLGLAFCIGLAEEAGLIAEALGRQCEVVSVCCKVCGIDKKSLDMEQIDPKRKRESMCNPAGQATLLNEAETEFNVLCGLCVGHDAIFSMVSRAPVTTLVVKDRVLAHNPLGAIYSRYGRRELIPDRERYGVEFGNAEREIRA